MKKNMTSPDDYLITERYETEETDIAEETQVVTEKDKKILERFDKRYKAMKAYWQPLYEEMAEDWEIYQLKQWTESAKAVRKMRPQVTCDISRKFVKSVVAETFKSPPGVKLTARDEGASHKAQAISDAIRYFEDKSGSIYAYTNAQECAAVGGIGWIKVSYAYDEQEALPAVIKVDRVIDPLSIMIDPDARELDGSDMIDAVECHGETHRAGTGLSHDEKYTYWWRDDKGLICWAIIEGKRVESKGVFPGIDIPIVPVYGEYYCIGGDVSIFGLIRQLRDTQRSWNYILSEGIERIALTPKSPIVAVEGSIPQQYMGDWIRSMTEPVPILQAAGYDDKDRPLPLPSRNATTPDVEWMPSLLNQLMSNARETTGIYDSSLGQQDNQAQSGVAIKARQDSGDRGQLVYSEHLQIAVKMVGRLMLGLLEPVLGPAGILPTLSEDGKTQVVQVGQNPDGSPIMGQQIVVPDLSVTDLDISISSAPAFATRKADGLEQIQKLIAIKPDLAPSVMDIIVRNMDFPGSKEIADRLAKLLPPELQDQSQGDPAQMQQQMAQMGQQLTDLQAQLTKSAQDNQVLTMQLNQNTQTMLAKAEMDNNARVAVAQINQTGANNRQAEQIAADAQKHNAELAMEVANNQAKVQGGIVTAPPSASIIQPKAPVQQPMQ